MPSYVIGQPGQRGFVVEAGEPPLAEHLPPGASIIEWTGKRPQRPVISDDGKSVELEPVPLGELRAARWTEAAAYRNGRQDSGCTTPLGRVDTDPDSQRKINGAATAAMIAQVAGQAFQPIAWTMADNSVVDHDGDAMIAMGLAVVAYLDVCQQAGTAIRGRIEAATTVAALAAVDITDGYPA